MTASRSEGFAYLFERFPSFTQTFCFREALEMRRQGVQCPLWSIRDPRDEAKQDFPAELEGLAKYVPESFEANLRRDANFRRQARRAIGDLRGLWGGEAEKRRIYEALWLLPRLRRQRVGHVHVHFAGTAARTAFWLKRLGGIHYSFTAHANDIFCDEPAERLEMLVREAEFVVTVSDFSVRFLIAKFPEFSAKFLRIYNGIHPDRFRRSVPDARRPLVLSVGRYVEKKGFGDLIAACRMLGDRSFDCLIVGQGPLEESLRRAAGSDGRIRITGPKGQNEIVDLLSRASIFALPCVDEEGGGKDNLPTVIMEAMAAAVPSVSTNIAGIPEMVADGVTGRLIAPHDVHALAECLGDLLDDPSRASAMGEAARCVCEEKFSTERTTAQLIEVLGKYGAFTPPQGWWSRLLARKA